MTKVAAAAALSLFLVTGAARSDESHDKERVRQLFVEGTKKYNLGQFDEALGLFTTAYEARPDPAFLYNIAQCYRMLHRPADAAREYRAYLREAPGAPNRPEIEQRIQEMEVQAEAAKPKPAPILSSPTSVTAAAPPDEEHGRRPLWLALGIGAAALVVAAIVVGVIVAVPTHSAAPMSTLGNFGAF